MPNGLYQNWINNILGNGTHTNVALHGHTAIIVTLVDETTSGIPNLATDVAESDLGIESTDYEDADAACTSVVAGNTTIGATTYGGFDHALVTWTTPPADVYESLTYYDNTSGTNTTNPLICNIDSATGLSPITTNGGNVTWDPHADGVFQLLTA